MAADVAGRGLGGSSSAKGWRLQGTMLKGGQMWPWREAG